MFLLTCVLSLVPGHGLAVTVEWVRLVLGPATGPTCECFLQGSNDRHAVWKALQHNMSNVIVQKKESN